MSRLHRQAYRYGKKIKMTKNIYNETYMLKNVHRPTGNNNSGKDINNQKSPEILVEIPPQKYAKKLVKKHTKNKNNTNKNKKTNSIATISSGRTPDSGRGKPKVLRALLDSGSTGCIILHEFTQGLPTVAGRPEQWMTKGGTFTTTGKCRVPMILADFTRSTTIKYDCYVDSTQKSSTSNYDLILGKDFQQEFGIDILNSSLTLRWEGIEVPMRDFGELRQRKTAQARGTSYLLYTAEAGSVGELQNRATRILDAYYVKADLKQVVNNQTHLSLEEQVELSLLLHKYEHLFDGTLGVWKGSGVSFELKKDAKPYHAKPYPIPHIHENPTRKEVERLCKLGVLAPCLDSEWGAPSFIIPKKNLTVRFLSDFRKLNSMLKRKPFPIPKIQDMLQKLEGFRYATALDLNMGYYTIRLNPDAQRLCTIVLPWGKYKYLRLPMGVSAPPTSSRRR